MKSLLSFVNDPTDKGYKPYEYPLDRPIIINKHNVINIVDGEKGIGVVTPEGNTVIKNTVKLQLN